MLLGIGGSIGGGGSTISIIDVVDPFGDGSGKALYQLNGNALDLSGNYNGTATSVAYAEGKFGQCGVFSAGSHVTLPTIPSITGVNNSTLSLWCSFNSIANHQGPYEGRNLNALGYNLVPFNGKLILNGGGASLNSTKTALEINKMYHIVITREENFTTMYLDNSIEVFGTFIRSNGTFLIELGRTNSSNTYGLNGKIDQVRIFNKALTVEEVAILYTETIVA